MPSALLLSTSLLRWLQSVSQSTQRLLAHLLYLLASTAVTAYDVVRPQSGAFAQAQLELPQARQTHWHA